MQSKAGAANRGDELRILAGSLRGRSLAVPPGTRPTGGRAKEALFSRWQVSIPGSSFLDLFAGSGAIGFEASSRGALEVLFVERDARALTLIRKNSRALDQGHCRVLRGLLPRLPEAVSARAPFDHVFADPPYDFDAYPKLLEAIAAVLSPVGEAAIEHARRVPLDRAAAGLMLRETRDYGESRLSYYALDELR